MNLLEVLTHLHDIISTGEYKLDRYLNYNNTIKNTRINMAMYQSRELNKPWQSIKTVDLGECQSFSILLNGGDVLIDVYFNVCYVFIENDYEIGIKIPENNSYIESYYFQQSTTNDLRLTYEEYNEVVKISRFITHYEPTLTL